MLRILIQCGIYATLFGNRHIVIHFQEVWNTLLHLNRKTRFNQSVFLQGPPSTGRLNVSALLRNIFW